MKRIFKGLVFLTANVLLAACASAPANPFVGVWDVSINTPMGVMGATLDVASDLSGAMRSDQLGATAMKGVTVTGNAVSFNVVIDAQGQTLPLSFAGTIDGRNLSGNFDSDFGAIPVTAVRQ